MTPSKLILSVTFVFLFIGVSAQIISVIEYDRGDERTIAKNEKQIIEINSRLEMKVSKVELSKTIKEQFPQFGEQIELEENLIGLRDALRNQSTIVTILENEFTSADDQQSFFEMMDVLLDKIQNNSFLSDRYEALSDNFFNTAEFMQGALPEPFILSNFNNDLLLIKEKLRTLEAEKYMVSVVAYKKDKHGGDRVHVQNFDTYTERDYITIPRWVTSLSNEQKEQLKDLTKIAEENNKKMINIFEMLKTKILTETPSIICIKEFKTQLSERIKNTQLNSLLSEQTKKELATLFKLIDQINTTYELIKTNISQWTITTPFDIRDQIQFLVDAIKKLELDFNVILSSVSNDLLEPFKTKFNECHNVVKGDFNKFQNGIALLFNTQTNYLTNKTIGKEVIAFSLDNLPESGFINLKGTGDRQNGDELLIEMVLRIPSSLKDAPDQFITLEQRAFIMQLIGVRSEVAVGLIFANPFDKADLNLESDRNFFYTPSASILLKFGSKKSYFYNDFLDFGVGLNFAAPDFNTDGTPEFGTGIITTAFKDIISVGLNYNVTLDNFYWFFGINLPFNFPGIPVNTIKP